MWQKVTGQPSFKRARRQPKIATAHERVREIFWKLSTSLL